MPLPDGCADLVYTGKGVLVWMPDIDAGAAETAIVRAGPEIRHLEEIVGPRA